MAITSAINDLFASIYELLASVFNTVYTIIHSILSAVLGFVQGLFNLIGDVVSGLVDVTGGVGKFVASEYPPLSCLFVWLGNANEECRQCCYSGRRCTGCFCVCEIYCAGKTGCEQEDPVDTFRCLMGNADLG